MPRRKTSGGWSPKLTHLKHREIGRVRLPGQGDVYFGPAGVWPAGEKEPPTEVEEAYRKAVADWLAAGGEKMVPRTREGTKIADLAAAYLVHVEKTYRKRGRPTAEYRHTQAVCRPLGELFADVPADEFGAKESRAVRDELLRGQTCSKSTIQSYGARLKAMFAWGELEGMVAEQTMLAVQAVRWFGRGVMARETPGRKQPVPRGDVNKTLPHAPPHVQAMVNLQLVTGMRVMEVSYLRANDIIDEKNGLWRYEARDAANKLAHRGIPKVVYLGKKARKILRPWLKKARKQGPDTWVFPLTCRDPDWGRDNNYRNAIGDACEKAGVPLWSPGRLRHSRGIETERRYGEAAAQAELGHTSPQMTKKHYTHSLRDELARKVARESG